MPRCLGDKQPLPLASGKICPMEISELRPSSDEPLASVLLSLQHVAYAVEAAVIGDDRIPPLHETLDELCGAPLRWLGAFDGRRLVGAIAWSEDSSKVDIDRLVVDPALHRQGIGNALVRLVLARAGDRRTTVSTGRANVAARALYERLGFTVAGEKEVIPSLWIALYAHDPSAAAAV